jgi:hypothetical protein
MTKPTKLNKLTSLPAALAGFTPLELARKIPVSKAADMNDQHEQTFRKNHGHLVRQISKRRQGVTLYDAIVLPPPPE